MLNYDKKSWSFLDLLGICSHLLKKSSKKTSFFCAESILILGKLDTKNLHTRTCLNLFYSSKTKYYSSNNNNHSNGVYLNNKAASDEIWYHYVILITLLTSFVCVLLLLLFLEGSGFLIVLFMIFLVLTRLNDF